MKKKVNDFMLVGDGALSSDEEKGKVRKADFEEAITACGYGKFQYLLVLALVPACSAQVYSSVTMSYVIPIAECDLKLTNNHKGALNAAVYVGLTLGAFSGGFASDVFGRRKLIMLGYLMEFMFNIMASLSYTFWILFLMKICAGFSIAGPIASVLSYSAETHNNHKRSQIIMMNGGLSALAQGVQPVLAWYLLPKDFRVELVPGVLYFTSWRLFLLLSAVPSLLASIAFLFFPESPKFLMSKGQTEQALESFKRIYAINTGKAASTYPIADLDIPPRIASTAPGLATTIRNGWKQIRPMFRPPYLNTAFVVFAISACTLIAMNSVRLWVPQLFATLNEAKRLNGTGATTICGLIGSVAAPSRNELSEKGHVCPPISGDVYLRSFVISATAAFSFLITTPVIGWIGKRNFAKLCFPCVAAVAISINWATNSDTFMALLSVYTALIRNAFSVMSTITVDLFPTAFRSMAMSMIAMCGRIASMTGNLLFPVLLNISCGVVFFSLGGVLALASALVWLVSNRDDNL